MSTAPEWHYARTRTGTRIHQMHSGSSVTRCGHWQKAASHYFAVAPELVDTSMLCKSCFGPRHTVRTDAVERPAVAEVAWDTITLAELRRDRGTLGDRFFPLKQWVEKRDGGMALETWKRLWPMQYGRAVGK